MKGIFSCVCRQDMNMQSRLPGQGLLAVRDWGRSRAWVSQALVSRALLLTVWVESLPELLTSSQRVHYIPQHARGRPKECSTVG